MKDCPQLTNYIFKREVFGMSKIIISPDTTTSPHDRKPKKHDHMAAYIMNLSHSVLPFQGNLIMPNMAGINCQPQL